MKTRITDGKKYLALFIAFSFFLCASLTLLIALGSRMANEPSRSQTEDSESEREDLTGGVIVVIDAGHGGEDGGAVGRNGALEKDINLSLALTLSDALEAMGVATLLTREEDILLYDKSSDYQGQKKAQDLAERRRIAESCENAIFVSIHMNSFPEEKYKGLQVYYSENNEESMTLAKRIQSLTAESLQPENNRQCKSGGNIYLLERLTCPAILIECGFLSNAEECELLSTEEYRQSLAKLIATAIYGYLAN